MKIKEYRNQFIQELLSAYAGEAESFYLILEEKHQLRIDLALDPELIFRKELALWNSILEQLKLEIPIQYLLGALVLWFEF
jgi:release factor glutamine methyltransferase